MTTIEYDDPVMKNCNKCYDVIQAKDDICPICGEKQHTTILVKKKGK